MIIEGRNAVTEALRGDVTIEKLMIQEGSNQTNGRIIAMAKNKKIKITVVEKIAIDKISTSKNHQGVLAVATDFKYSTFEEVCENNTDEKKLIIILDGIEDPHNLGAIIRIADSVNANGIILPRHRSCGVTDTAVKVSSGASAFVKIAKVANINDAIRKLKEMNIWIMAADMNGNSAYQTDLTDDIAIVIGSEGNGVHPLTKKLVDGIISLPQKGKINSLNASVATGCLLYECIRQREQK